MSNKKKFKETKVGKFLSKIAPSILGIVGDVFPSLSVLKKAEGLIKTDVSMTPLEKETALGLLEMDKLELQQISERWKADMSSDSWLSKNTRPMTLIFLTISMVVLIMLDSLDLAFKVDSSWVDLLKSLLLTVYVAYFGSRGIEKFKSMQN